MRRDWPRDGAESPAEAEPSAAAAQEVQRRAVAAAAVPPLALAMAVASMASPLVVALS